MQRWKEHFQELLETETIYDREEHEETANETINRAEQSKDEIEITKEELVTVIKEMKTGKAPGDDRITVEMIKKMGENGLQMLLQIINMAWQKEKIPKDWEIRLILPVHKKGDTMDSQNYRGITLLSTPTKIFEKIIEKRIRKEVEPKLLQVQSGFRKGKSTQDHVFTIKEIMNRTLARSKTIYITFMDMEKAFDRVPRAQIWECLREKRINEKLIRVTKSMYKETRNKIIYKNAESEIFHTNEGVRQGGCLSPLLFIIFMDHLIRMARTRTKPLKVGYRKMEKVVISECAFADDIALIASNENDIKENLKVWNEILLQNGMKMNKQKTKIMVVSHRTSEQLPIFRNNYRRNRRTKYRCK